MLGLGEIVWLKNIRHQKIFKVSPENFLGLAVMFIFPGVGVGTVKFSNDWCGVV